MMRSAAMTALALLHFLSACGDPALLDLKVVIPEGPDPLATVDLLRLTISNPYAKNDITVSNSNSFNIEVEVEVEGGIGTITLEGFASKTLVARGETPPLSLDPTDDQHAILVAKAGAFSRLRPRWASATGWAQSILLPASGVLLAGGLDGSGSPTARVSLYDFFEHTLKSLTDLPEPRAAGLGILCGSSCALVTLGLNDKGLATTILRLTGKTWEKLADGLTPADRRQDPAVASLGDGTYLVLGGKGLAGALDSMLVLDPGATSQKPGFSALSLTSKARRIRPAIASGKGFIVTAGGQISGPPAEILYFTPSSMTTHALSLPGPVLESGAGAVALDNGKVALIGGRDTAQQLIRDAWVVDPVTMKVSLVKDVLESGRADHRVLSQGTRLLVIGGVTSTGAAASAELLLASDLSQEGKATHAPRQGGFVVERLGTGSFLVAGGLDRGAPVTELEVFQTSQTLK